MNDSIHETNEKKILLLGDPKSLYIIQYIENVLEPLGFRIYMQADFSVDMNSFSNFFLNQGITNVKFYQKSDKKIFRIPFVGKILRFISNIVQLNRETPFDYIHLHFVNLRDIVRIFFIKKNKQTKIYASFWGSDLLRVSNKLLYFEKKFLNKYTHITLSSLSMLDKYVDFFKSQDRMDIVYFGASLLPYIDIWGSKKEECRASLSVPNDKLVISVGYNGKIQQQHDKVLCALNTILDKNKYFIIIQNTYGSENEDYYEKLLLILKNSGFSYKILSGYQSMDSIAKLRVATDIFINAQTTDAFCNSIKEYMYAKTYIISAAWLHYPEIDSYKLCINEFYDFSQIPELLCSKINEQELEWNKRKIKEESSWESCCNKWREIYEVDTEYDKQN